MKKRNLCMMATLLCGLLAVAFMFNNHSVIWLWQDNKPIAVVLGLLCAIFGTQWIEYQRRHDTNAARPGWPTWLRRMLFCNLFHMAVWPATLLS